MVNEVFFSHHLNSKVKQVDKRTARKLYDKGETVYFLPSNMMFGNVWQYPMPASKDGFSYQGYSFDSVCSSFAIYNCDNYRGRYIHFFVTL